MKNVFTALSLFVSLAANAATVKTAPPMRVSGLSTYAGKYLTVFLVSGRDPGLGFSGSTAAVNAVHGRYATQQIPYNGSVDLDGTTYVSSIYFKVMNHVLFVVHSSAAPVPFLKTKNDICPSVAKELSFVNSACAATKPRYPYNAIKGIDLLDLADELSSGTSLVRVNFGQLN